MSMLILALAYRLGLVILPTTEAGCDRAVLICACDNDGNALECDAYCLDEDRWTNPAQ